MTPLQLRIAELRAVKGWTQDQLAEAADVSRVTVNRIESGRSRRVDLDVLEKLADALGVDPGYLIAKSTTKMPRKRK